MNPQLCAIGLLDSVSYIIGVMKRESPRALPKHLALEQRRRGRRDSISELGPRIGARPCQLKGELKDDLACAGGWEQKNYMKILPQSVSKMRRGPKNGGDARSVEPRTWDVNDGFP